VVEVIQGALAAPMATRTKRPGPRLPALHDPCRFRRRPRRKCRFERGYLFSSTHTHPTKMGGQYEPGGFPPPRPKTKQSFPTPNRAQPILNLKLQTMGDQASRAHAKRRVRPAKKKNVTCRFAARPTLRGTVAKAGRFPRLICSFPQEPLSFFRSEI